MIQQVHISIATGMKRYSDTSIPNFLCLSVDSLHICIPKFLHWFGFISDFSILFPNHKPLPKPSINTSPEFSVNSVTSVQIGIFTFLYFMVGMEAHCPTLK